MPGIIVPYARFVEIRQRRQRVAAELARGVATPNGDSLDAQSVTVDAESRSDEQCGTREAPTRSSPAPNRDEEASFTAERPHPAKLGDPALDLPIIDCACEQIP
jgi:hypothetical protein